MDDGDDQIDGVRHSIFRAVFRAMQQPFLLVGGDGRIRFGNPAFYRHFRAEPREIDGRLLSEVHDGLWQEAGIAALHERVLATGAPEDGYRVDRLIPRLGHRVMRISADPVEVSGEARDVLLAITDLTVQEAQLEFEEKLIDAVREGLIILNADLRVQRANLSFYEMFGVRREETENQLIYDLGNRQWDIPELRHLLHEVIPQNDSFDDYEVVHEFEGLGERIMFLNGRRIDHLDMILLAIRDVTDERRAAKRQEMLRGELQHRVKNILNNVQALLRQTRRSSDTMDGFVDAFGGRIQSLSRVQDLFVRGESRTVDLRDLVTLELDSRGAADNANVDVTGPPVTLDARQAQALAMALHELATNAGKYGALAQRGGRLTVQWRTETTDGADQQLRLAWLETGVSIGSVPARRGFGCELIEEGLPFMLGGTSELTFEEDAVRCHIAFSLRGEGSAAPDRSPS